MAKSIFHLFNKKGNFNIENVILIKIIFFIFRFGQQYLENCLKLYCNDVSTTSAFNLELCLTYGKYISYATMGSYVASLGA